MSAHRSPDLLYRYAEAAAGRGIRVIIAGAGGAAHLPGMLAAKTTLPVIGVPMPTKHLGGLDSLLSIVQMPRGIPVATVAIGNAENAALLAVEILALSDDRRWRRPPRRRYRADQTQMVLDDPSNATATTGESVRRCDRAPGLGGPMDDPRWEPGMPVLDRQAIREPTSRRAPGSRRDRSPRRSRRRSSATTSTCRRSPSSPARSRSPRSRPASRSQPARQALRARRRADPVPDDRRRGAALLAQRLGLDAGQPGPRRCSGWPGSP